MSPIKKQAINIKYQSGQTMVFSLVFIVVILIGVIILFNTGQLTRHKMEVQNAADAAAYSAAILTARELNYMAFSNRAMVANQVTIGQLAAFQSWGKKYKLAQYPGPAPVLSYSLGFYTLYGLTYGISVLYADASNTLYQFVYWPLKILFTGLHYINTAISTPMHFLYLTAEPYVEILQYAYVIHQQALRFFTLATQIETIPKIIDDNAKGAKLSNFGTLATLASAAELQFRFLAKAGVTDKKDKTKGAASTRRFAAFVNDQRDDWTRDRRREDLKLPIPSVTLPLGILNVTIKPNVGFTGTGGTDLRFIDNKGTEEYGWSSLDGISAAFGIDVKLKFLEICLPPPLDDQCVTPPSPPGFFLGLPLLFEGAAFETVEGTKTLGSSPVPTKVDDTWGQGDYGGSFDTDYLVTYLNSHAIFENVVGAKRAKNYTARKKKYFGLPAYVDIDAINYPAVEAAPVFIISVRKDGTELRTSDQIEQNKKLMVGEFELQTKLAGGDNTDEGEPGNLLGNTLKQLLEDQKKKILDGIMNKAGPAGGIVTGLAKPQLDKVEKLLDDQIDQMQNKLNNILTPINWSDPKGGVFALAAGEVYFKNPDDTAEQVYGSTFSPFWQARLKRVDDDVRRWSVISQGLKFNDPPPPPPMPDGKPSYLKPLSIMGK